MRNAIGLATNPDTGTLWAGGAGQDNLPLGHPYEYFDAVTLHAGLADYGWPVCEENNNAYGSGADCSSTVAPLIELPAYSTIIGGVFYPASQAGKHAFPANYRGLFLSGHGSWHMTNNVYYTAPRVAFVAMNGDAPATAVDWTDPSKQWTEFVGGFQLADQVTRIARPTGITVGKEGSLFLADDENGLVYRIRPSP
jgi:glucose/arabinose dehydrogenase